MHRTGLMGKGWLECPVLWPCIWNIFSVDKGMRDGNASFTLPCRVIDLAESPAANKDNLTMLFAPENLFWVFNVCTYFKILKEGTFWRGDIPQLNQNVLSEYENVNTSFRIGDSRNMVIYERHQTSEGCSCRLPPLWAPCWQVVKFIFLVFF